MLIAQNIENWRVMRWMLIFPLLLLSSLVGCKSEEFPVAPISGVITLDGKPLEGAKVGFGPRAKPSELVAGPGAYGKTDANGAYQLRTLDGKEGAVIGPNKVTISKWKTKTLPNGEVIALPVDLIPRRYNSDTELSFDVAPGGTSDANFDLVSK